MQADFEIQRAVASLETPDDKQFRAWIDAVEVAPNRRYRLTIRIVDEVEAQRFNREYRKRDYATNVLSFPAELPAGLPAEVRESELGDLLICAPVVIREASEQHRSADDHWAHLTIHGLLHLLGYDHQQREEAAIMEALEIETLAKLGISDPYVELT